jgi:hypothetical protein
MQIGKKTTTPNLNERRKEGPEIIDFGITAKLRKYFDFYTG